MTGSVPYYGGRFTPAQAWAASHPTGRPPRPRPDPRATEAALRHLRASGVLTEEEYHDLMARARR